MRSIYHLIRCCRAFWNKRLTKVAFIGALLLATYPNSLHAQTFPTEIPKTKGELAVMIKAILQKDAAFLKSFKSDSASASATMKIKNEDVTLVAFKRTGMSKVLLAIVPKDFKLTSFVPIPSGTPVDGVKFSNAALVYVPKGAGKSGVSTSGMPSSLTHSFNGLGGKATFKDGLNIFGNADFQSAGAVKKVLSALGHTNYTLPLSGVFSSDILRYDIKSASAKLKEELFKGLSLNLPLPKLKIPGMPNTVSVSKAHLSIVGKEVKGKHKIFAGVTGELAVKLGSKSHPFNFGILTGDKIELTAQSTDKITLSFFKSLALTNLSFKATKKNGKWSTSVDAKSKLNNKDVDVTIYKPAKGDDFALVTTDTKLSDLLPSAVQVPGLTDITFTKLAMFKNHVEVRGKVKGMEMVVVALKHNNKHYIAANVVKDFDIGSIIPDVKNTPLSDAKFENMVFVWAPKNGAVKNLDVSVLTSDIETPARTTANKINLKPGITILGQMVISKSSKIGKLLSKVGAYKNKIKLNGNLSAAIFHPGSSANIKNKILDSLDLNLPLPKLIPPGMPNAVSLGRSRLSIKGTKKGNVRGVDVDMAGELIVKAGSQNVAFDFDLDFQKKAGGKTVIKVTGKSKPGSKLSTNLIEKLTLTNIGFAASDDGGKWDWQISGDARFRSKTVSIDYLSNHTLLINAQMTLAEIAGHAGLPVLDDIKSNWIYILPNAVRVDLNIKGVRSDLNLWKPAGSTKFYVGFGLGDFSPTAFIPDSKNSPLKDATFERLAFVYNPTKANNRMKAADFPDEIGYHLQTSGPANLVLKPGLNVYGHLDIHPSGKMAKLLKNVGVTNLKLPLNGKFSPKAFAKNHSAAAIKNDILDNLDLSIKLPTPHIAEISKFVTFKNGKLKIKGKLPDGTRGIDIGISGDVDVKVKSDNVAFFVEVEYDRAGGSSDLHISGHTDKVWTHPMGIGFLNLESLKVDIKKKKRSSGDSSFDIKMTAKTDIGSHSKLDVKVDVHEKNGKVTDAFFELDGPLKLSEIPGVKDIPHSDSFTLDTVKISEHGIEAKTDYAGRSDLDIYLFHGSGWNLILRQDNFSIARMIPPLKHTPLKHIVLSETAVIISKDGLTGPLSGFSVIAQDALKDIYGSGAANIDVEEGVSLIAAFEHKKSKGGLSEAFSRLGLNEERVMLTGNIGGIFWGPAKLELEVDLSAHTGAKNQPKWMKSKPGVEAVFSMIATETAGQFDVEFGIGVDIIAKVHGTELVFEAKTALEFEDEKIDVKIVADLKDKKGWKKPFGIPGFTLYEVGFDLGIAEDGAIHLGFDGDIKVSGDTFKVKADADLLPEALGAPQDIAFVGSATKVDMFFMEAIAIDMIGGNFKLDLPNGILPTFTNVKFAFVTPGAQDPDLHITGEGFALKGAMNWLDHELGDMDIAVGPKTGIVADGKIDNFELGPLTLKNNDFHLKAGIKGLPTLKVDSDIEFLGIKERFNIAFDKSGASFDATLALGPDISMTTDLKLTGVDFAAKKPDFKNADFYVAGDLKLDIGKFIAGPGKAAVTNIFNELNADFAKGLKAVTAAQSVVDGLTTKINAARAKVRKEKAAAEAKLQGPEDRVNALNGRLSGEWRSYHHCHGWHKWPCRIREGIRIGWTKAEIRTADAVLNLAKSAISHFQIDLDPTVAKLLIEQDAAKGALYLAKKAIEGLDVLAPIIKKMTEALTSGLDNKGVANSINIKKAAFQGDLQGIIKHDEPVDLTIDAELFGKEVKDTFSFKLKDISYDVEQIGLLGLYAIEHLISGVIKDIPGPLKNKIRGALATKMDAKDASRKRELAKYSKEFAGYGAAANALQELYAAANTAYLEAQYANMASPLDAETTETITNDMIEVGHTGLCLSSSEGKIVELACDGKITQKWSSKTISGAPNVTPGAGYVYITQSGSGDCIAPAGSWISVAEKYTDADQTNSDTFSFLEPRFKRDGDGEVSVGKCINSKEYYWKILKHGDGWQQFANLASSQCLHFENSNAVPGKAKAVWKPCTGAANQVYRTASTLTPKYHADDLAILNIQGEVCVENPDAGKDSLRLVNCSNANVARFNYAVDIRGDIKFINRKSGKCLQPDGYSNHTNVVERECTQVDFQWWTVVQKTGGQLIQNSQSKLCMVFPVAKKELQVTGCSNNLKSVVNFIRVDDSVAWIGTGSPPVAPKPKPGAFTNVNLVNGRGFCLDESTGKMTNGVDLIVWSCNGVGPGPSQKRQTWSQNELGQIYVSNGLCLDVNNPSVTLGMKLILWGCNGGTGPSHQRQRWRALRDGQIQHIGSGFCIDSTNNGAKDGQIQLQTCNTNSPSQTFNKPKSVSGVNTFKRKPGAFTNVNLVNGRGFCIDESTGKMTKGVDLIVWSCNGVGSEAAQKRQTWSQNKDAQILVSNGLCLDLNTPWARPGIKLILWTCDGGGKSQLRQRWQVLSDGRIKHKPSGLCIDSTESGNKDSAMILATCVEYSPSQTFNKTQVFLGSPSSTTESNAFKSVNLVSGQGFCIDEGDGKMTRGAGLIVWTCNGVGSAPSQKRQT